MKPPRRPGVSTTRYKDMYNKNTVKLILESSIKSLIDNFVKQPHIHRCEHSIHCELYNMLMGHHGLQGIYSLSENGSQYATALIHKERPETVARPEKNKRRGNFDIAILSPDSIAKSSLEDFTKGFIKPDFVIEIGLNYGLDHLSHDDSKLVNSGCDSGYLIHLWQPHMGITTSRLEDLKNWLPNAQNKVAAAVVCRGDNHT